MPVSLHEGDCLDILKTLPDDSVDSVVTDPPYGLEFMGKEWDGADGFRRSLNIADAGRNNAFGRYSRKGPEYRAGHLFQAWCELWGREVLRVLKPGGHLVSFSGTRTYHRMVVGIEDAGFEIRDQIGWLYGSGFPKSLNLADDWKGWGTALKPAWEPIVLARKPLIGTVVENVQTHGTGAMNIDDCRVPVNDAEYSRNCSGDRGHSDNRTRDMEFAMGCGHASAIGRWPANVLHDGSPEVLDAFAVFGESKSTGGKGAASQKTALAGHVYGQYAGDRLGQNAGGLGDSGTAARFFYAAKASKAERRGSKHPTVKPLSLIRYLCRLVTPCGGTILDPFAGTGTTGRAAVDEGFDAILIERESEYCGAIRGRLVFWLTQGPSTADDERLDDET